LLGDATEWFKKLFRKKNNYSFRGTELKICIVMKRTKWFERKFAIIEDSGLLPAIIERLEGTSIRLVGKLETLNPNTTIVEEKGKWSIKKEVGHLIDLEPLWLARMKEILTGKKDLMIADLNNTKTHEANHNGKSFFDLVNDFSTNRQILVNLLRGLREEDLDKAAKHPRLGTPMRIIDLAYFVAEHDDHHLVQITYLQSK
jgi:uncharacterized damage-inducible protein DinB